MDFNTSGARRSFACARPGHWRGALGGVGSADRSLPPPARNCFPASPTRCEVRNSPRPLVIHTLLVDLRDPGVRLLVTPGDPDAERSLQACTTSAFLGRLHLQAAVNGDGFEPWVSNSIFRYYPHVGDPIDPIGLAASQGTQYAQGNGAEPTLFISRNNRAALERAHRRDLQRHLRVS